MSQEMLFRKKLREKDNELEELTESLFHYKQNSASIETKYKTLVTDLESKIKALKLEFLRVSYEKDKMMMRLKTEKSKVVDIEAQQEKKQKSFRSIFNNNATKVIYDTQFSKQSKSFIKQSGF